MNATASLKAWNLDVDLYLIHFPRDDVSVVSRDRAVIEHEIASFNNPFSVVWFNAAEGWSRDVTDEFEAADEPLDYPEYDRAASLADHLYQARKEGAA